jgi:parallel beta-helix repeat protein
MDTWEGGVGGSDKSYPHQTLILGNAVFNNGGRGIHNFASSNITTANNTVYGNALDLYDGSYYFADLSQSGGHNNVWVNNVAQTVQTQANASCEYCGDRNAPIVAGNGRGVVDTNITWVHNVTFGGDGVQLFDNDVGYFSAASNKTDTNPLFVDPASVDLKLQAASPARGYAQPESYVPSWMTSVGAYQ